MYARLITALLFVPLATASAQLRDTEKSLIDLSFKASHNSYDKPESIMEQIDDHNVWCIELDLCGFDDDNNANVFSVRHGDPFEDSHGSLVHFAGQVRQSEEWRNRVTFILLDIKVQVGCRWGAHGENRRANYDIIAERLEASLGADRIYRQSDWEADGRQWPSVEQLIRRGKHFICIYDNNDGDNDGPGEDNYGGNLEHDLLFVTAQNTDRLEEWTGFINTKDNNNEDFSIFQRPPLSRYLWRSYDLNEEAEFEAGVSSGRHLLATDEYTESWTDNGTVASTLRTVTNLNNSGPGSLRDAVGGGPGRKHVIFYDSLDGGTIDLTSALGEVQGTVISIPILGDIVAREQITIDASTLPNGLTLRGDGTHRFFEVGNLGTLELRNVTLTNGNAPGEHPTNDGDGGAILNFGEVTLIDCSLSNNTANDDGGAIFSEGEEAALTLNRCTINGNSAPNDKGGGIITFTGASCEITSSTITGNSARTEGGGLWAANGASLTVTHCSVVDNQVTSGFGGGIYNDRVPSNGTGTLELSNSIVAGNSAESGGPDIDGAINAATGVNLVEDSSGIDSGLGNALIGDARLSPLGDFGGKTMTRIPLPGSPAIYAAQPIGNVSIDQLQAIRHPGHPTIGATEVVLWAAFPLEDNDGDTIDDRLETALGLVVGDDDTLVDSDSDGSPDADELRNMTNPLDPNDYFRILSIEKTTPFFAEDPRFDVTIPTFPGLNYDFEELARPELAWRPIESARAEGTSTTTELRLRAGTGLIRAVRK